MRLSLSGMARGSMLPLRETVHITVCCAGAGGGRKCEVLARTATHSVRNDLAAGIL